MANETRGILFETIADAALKQAVKLAGIVGTVRWNEKPENMSIVPDFTIGLTKDEPSHIILVTAIGAARNADMKSWRSLGEMQEVKAQLPTVPTVLNLFFKSEVKQGLASLGIALYDSTLHIDHKSYYEPLETWVQENVESDVKTREARQEMLASDMKTDPDLDKAITFLAKDLGEVLQQRNSELDQLWALMQLDFTKPRTLPQAKKTTVRRGLGKLLVLEPQVRQLVYAGYDKPNGIQLDAIPQYAWDLGFFKKSLVGAKLADQEIEGALNLLGATTCELILNKCPLAMQSWIDEMRQLENIPIFLDFLFREFSNITDSKQLIIWLSQCHNDPTNFAKTQNIIFSGILSRNWLFTILMDLVKASTGKLQGFGYAQLAAEIGSSANISSGYITIADWANCLPNVNLPDSVIQQVSEVLVKKITTIGKTNLPQLSRKLIEVTKKSALEDRLIPYRNFEPLLWLLEAELEKQGKSYIPKVPYVGWVNEYAGVGKNSATTPFVKVGNTLIHWKSVSDAGKDHKKKELAARARSIKYQYSLSTRTFTHRPGVDQLALIVDGTFNDNDLKILASAGWDIIVYPDQIEELVSSL
jgi:hypothetical protein